METTFEEALLAVWQQVLIDEVKVVKVAGDTFSVRTTTSKKLRQVDFKFEGRNLRGLEQNPNTKSRWAGMARKGAKVMQFLEQGAYVAVVADGKAHVYPAKSSGK
jgi:hypothetical protein